MGRILTINIAKGSTMARSSKLITLCVALVAFVAVRSVAFLGTPGPQAQLRGTPLEIAAGAAVPAVLMTPQLPWPLMAPLLWCWELAFFACWRLSAQSPASSAQLSRLSLTKCKRKLIGSLCSGFALAVLMNIVLFP